MEENTTTATYGKLFPEQVADKCASDALEANNGPLAYLHALYRQALTLEAQGNPDSQIKLASRRPDIGERVLDKASLENQVSALTLVIEAMTRQAKLHVGEKKNLVEEISKAQYPVQLPFHRPLEQIKAVLKQKKTSLFDVLQRSHYHYPNFTSDTLRSEKLRHVMLTATGFSPALQSLLIDSSAATDGDFLHKLYGVKGDASNALEQLTGVECLSRQTGLKPESILELLATSGVPDDGTEAITTVKCSSAYAAANEKNSAALGGHLYGAVFINNATAPALSLEDTYEGPGISLRIKGANADHFGRIHKIIHLQRALQLPFAHVDLLVMAALRAEGQTKDFQITKNTLRALGVFCYMRNEYDVTAEQFAALINGVTPYVTGEQTPFLDRVLDGPGAGQLADTEDRLTLDGREFEISVTAQSSDSSSKSVIGGICRAFALEERVANLYLKQAAQALKLTKPTLSLPVFSSLYRLTRLPRLLGLGTNEGNSLIALLAKTNPRVWTQLAGTPQITEGDYFYDGEVDVKLGAADILDVLTGLINLDIWLRRQKISAQALLSWLTPLPADIPAELKPLYRVDARIQRTLVDALPRIKASLLSETQIAQEVGLDVLPASGSWIGTLQTCLDSRGLVKTLVLRPDQSLADVLKAELKGKVNSANAVFRADVDIDQVIDRLERLITNATIAQEDAAKHIIGNVFAKDDDGRALTSGHALELLRWIEESRFSLLADVLTAAEKTPASASTALDGLTLDLWDKLARHAQVIKYLQLSPTGLKALLDHPAWFDLAGETDTAGQTPSSATALTLDLCYQVSRYSDWVQQCEKSGVEENDALNYFSNAPQINRLNTEVLTAGRLGKLIGWSESETMVALSYAGTAKKETVKIDTSKPFDDFLASLTKTEKDIYIRSDYREFSPFGELVARHMFNARPEDSSKDARSVYDKFDQFLRDNPGPLKVRKELLLPETRPEAWDYISKYKDKNKELTLVEYSPTTVDTQASARLTTTISDIDLVLRLKNLCNLTGLSSESLLDLHSLDESSKFEAYRVSGQVLLGACDNVEQESIESRLQEPWRDALAAYLLGYWAASTPELKRFIPTTEELSSYFLTDVLVSTAVKVSAVNQATASLQHYLHRLFARLDPGYTTTIIAQETSDFWRQYLSTYGTWKVWRTQLNHPENLIYYANRPNKSTAFQALEVELNQGKLDPELLQTAITSYLTKFEQTSNLQVISGYLDGTDPKNDTYHFIGKTNASPAEYYWRSVDIGLRDDKERLSPLAWTEWEKISVSATGQIVQSSYTDPDTKATSRCDAIRPVMIEGRPYVFWVERGTVGLPSADDKNQTPTKFKKISVQYIYKQSDGFWSTPNELICLDGIQDGKRLPDLKNPYLKDDTYEPGLIALVNTEGERTEDPWLTVMLYNSAYTSINDTAQESVHYGNLNTDYFIEARDLLLIDKKQFPLDATKSLSKIIYNSYKDVTKVQHPYTGERSEIEPLKKEQGTTRFALEQYKPDTLTTPIRQWPQVLAKVDSVYEFDLHYQDFIKKEPLIPQSQFINYDTLHEIIPYAMGKAKYNENPDPANMLQVIENSSTPKYLIGKLLFPRPNSTNTITANFISGKALTLKGHYKKPIVNLTKLPTVTSIAINITFRINDIAYTVTSNQSNISIPNDDRDIGFQLPITVNTAEKRPLSIGYSVTDDNKKIQAKPETLPEATSPERWTVNLKLEKARYLLEDSLRIEFYLKDQLIASLPVDVVVNPKAYEKIELRLYAKGPKDKAFTRLTEESVVADGNAVITRDYPYKDSGQYMFALCEAGEPLQNVFTTFDVQALGTDEKWDIAIRRNTEQAQYLDLSAVADDAPTFPSNAIRLNTLFGKQLVSRAARSVERALEWEAQWIKEPTIDANIETPPVDFHGANGAYFRELFLHLPDLVATRLSEQQQFDEAERWYTQYLFDPFRTQKDDKERQPFWNTRPLAEGGTSGSELQKVVDPTARAFTLSRYYRQAVLLSLVDNWQRQGDHFYRQLTSSTLNHAWLCFQKALRLIGPLPERTSVSRWASVALNSASSVHFRAPINERVAAARKTLEHRLFNLRHGLTLDGKVLPVMDWRTESVDAFGVGQRGIGQLINTYNSDRAQIPAYRFRELIPTARTAVRQLQDMGRHYMKLMENEFNSTLSALLKQQQINVSDFTLQLKREAVNDEVTQKKLLELSKQAAVFRKEYYENLLLTGRSPMEEAATGLIWSAAVLKTMSVPLQIAAGITEGLVPTIYGMAFGGNKPHASMAKAALGMEIAAESSMFVSDRLLAEADYERRAQEWQFELKQAELDIESLNFELDESDLEYNAATISLEEARAVRANLEELHATMTNGFISPSSYNWLVARQELLYAPAYDAVLSLCLSAEAAWRYEIGDYTRPAFIKTGAWVDSYKGMLAGESLLVDLQEMENAHIQCNERRLSIKKTVDLRGTQTGDEWLATLKSLASAPLVFEFKSADFDKNYPGHYLRQLRHVSVSFVTTSAAGASLENVCAILTQTDSTTLVEPTSEGADYLYAPATKAPGSIKRNLRVQQQIALSSGEADDGLGFDKADWVYELMFHDGRYLPFEGTGAISRWQLNFTDADFVKSLLAADGKTTVIKTIQINLVYTALDGGKAFTDKVKTLMQAKK
ncbi:Tc toxin subunit A [Pseudomonas sp. KU26590]|uniref:Tc toxin subunit A-related protein n=1 Tax=Pseudomonas sp. KU26590 TaxID=2991051 RepID=UPI00223D38DA|nr:Tc toxin subunit A [Pseudomonas sp. KU26590]UZJ60797.1 Tc toxin subunit A [Pseudomonas sp. KU26590]